MPIDPIKLLDEPVPVAPRTRSGDLRVRPLNWLSRLQLWATYWTGRFLRSVFVKWRVPLVVVALAVGVAFLTPGEHGSNVLGAAIAFGAGVLISIVAAAYNARGRLVVGDFTGLPDTSAGQQKSEGDSADKQPPSTFDVGNLLQVELSRLGGLFQVVEDRRAVSSGFGGVQALDATLSVDDLSESLQQTVGPEAKVSVGPVSLPVQPLVALAGRALRAPRLTGGLHRDGEALILTAQQQGQGGNSWRVWARPQSRDGASAPLTEGVYPEETAQLSEMVSELALRIFTDLALGREVRWQASASFIRGLRKFRACLRTPKDRKVNLKEAEKLFLDALSEDEDFPLVYYNLGVVYTELHGLAEASGRQQEADMHRSAAEVSFGWAIDKNPKRWETYLALAQVQLRMGRYDDVLTNCRRIESLRPRFFFAGGRVQRPRTGDRAKTWELSARALLERAQPGDAGKAIEHARKAYRLARRALFWGRLVRKSAPGDERDGEPRCAQVAGACALTLGRCYSQLLVPAGEAGNAVRRWRREGAWRRSRALFVRAEALLDNVAEAQFELGLRALARERREIALGALGAAVQAEPTRPTYVAGLALAKARTSEPTGAALEEILEDCDRALEAMAGAFFPSRDASACELIAKVHDTLAERWGRADSEEVAGQLRRVAEIVRERLNEASSEASVAAFFFEALQEVEPPWQGRLGEYGMATRDARRLLRQGQGLGGDAAVAGAPRDNGDRRGGALRDALAQAEKATALNPLSSIAWETLGDVHRELRDFRNADHAWSYALSRDPDNPQLYDKIGSSHWFLAFEGRSGVLESELAEAAEYFNRALTLYGSAGFDEQLKTRYRLGKLYTALRRFGDAMPHMKIVEAMSPDPPVVGWLLLGLGHLSQHNFSECEYYFRCVNEACEALGSAGGGASRVVGDRLDEAQWPLGLVRAWAHLGLAFSYVERDGRREDAATKIEEARRLAREVPAQPFPTRILAACDDCEGFIDLRNGDVDDAIEKLHRAVGGFPFSRTYLNLALAYEKRARTDDDNRAADVEAALRFLDHATSLGPSAEPTLEVQAARARLEALAAA